MNADSTNWLTRHQKQETTGRTNNLTCLLFQALQTKVAHSETTKLSK